MEDIINKMNKKFNALPMQRNNITNKVNTSNEIKKISNMVKERGLLETKKVLLDKGIINSINQRKANFPSIKKTSINTSPLVKNAKQIYKDKKYEKELENEIKSLELEFRNKNEKLSNLLQYKNNKSINIEKTKNEFEETKQKLNNKKQEYKSLIGNKLGGFIYGYNSNGMVRALAKPFIKIIDNNKRFKSFEDIDKNYKIQDEKRIKDNNLNRDSISVGRNTANLLYQVGGGTLAGGYSPIVQGIIGGVNKFGETSNPLEIATEAGKEALFGIISNSSSKLVGKGIEKALPMSSQKIFPNVTKNVLSNYVGNFGASAITNIGGQLLTKKYINMKEIVNQANTAGIIGSIVGGTSDTFKDIKKSKIQLDKDIKKTVETLQNIKKQINEGDVSISKNPKHINKLISNGQIELDKLANNKYLMQDKKLKNVVDLLQSAYNSGNITNIKTANNHISGLLGSSNIDNNNNMLYNNQKRWRC